MEVNLLTPGGVMAMSITSTAKELQTGSGRECEYEYLFVFLRGPLINCRLKTAGIRSSVRSSSRSDTNVFGKHLKRNKQARENTYACKVIRGATSGETAESKI